MSLLILLPSHKATIWRFRPLGNPNFFEVNVGRDVLVIAGTANLVGIFYSSIQLYHNKLSAGGIFCVLGGNLIVTGFALNTITAANSQWGTGLQTYVGKLIKASGRGPK